MKFIPEEYILFVAALGAVFVKLVLTPADTLMKTLGVAFAGFFMALAFTDPIMWYFGFDQVMMIPVASVLTFTGDGIARQIIRFGSSPQEAKSTLYDLVELIKIWKASDTPNNKDHTTRGRDDDHRDSR